MPVIKKRLRRRAAEPVRAASNEGDRHPLLLSMSVARSKLTCSLDHLRYSSSLTFSIQSTFLPPSDSFHARFGSRASFADLEPVQKRLISFSAQFHDFRPVRAQIAAARRRTRASGLHEGLE